MIVSIASAPGCTICSKIPRRVYYDDWIYHARHALSVECPKILGHNENQLLSLVELKFLDTPIHRDVDGEAWEQTNPDITFVILVMYAIG